MLLMRITSGLYYDLVPGGASLLNDANDRFEQYCVDYISESYAAFCDQQELPVRAEGQPGSIFRDVLIKDGGKDA